MLEGILKDVNSKHPTEVNIIPIFEITVSNIINQILFGFSYHSEAGKLEFARYKDVIARHMQMGFSPSCLLGLTFPRSVRFLPFIKGNMDLLVNDYKFLTDYCSEQIEKHRAEMASPDYNSEDDPKDYVEAYLREAPNKPDSFTDIQLINNLFDLWIAGQETTSNTLIFSVLYILHNPAVQDKLHSELDSVVGSDRRITLSDKSSLTYMNAFINEVQRSVNLLPQNLLHKTMKDVKVGEYFIKKGTIILPQISNVLYDEKVCISDFNWTF